jgi:hypothetical protein
MMTACPDRVCPKLCGIGAKPLMLLGIPAPATVQQCPLKGDSSDNALLWTGKRI